MTLYELYCSVDIANPKERTLGDIEIILSSCYGIASHKKYLEYPIFKKEGLGLNRVDIERTILALQNFPARIKGTFFFSSVSIERSITDTQLLKIYFDSGHITHGSDINVGAIASAIIIALLPAAKDGILMVRKQIVKEKLESFKSIDEKIEWLTDTLVDWKQDKDLVDNIQYDKMEAFIKLEIERQKSKIKDLHQYDEGAQFTSESLFEFVTKLISHDLERAVRLDEGYRNFWRDQECTIPKNEIEVHQYIKTVIDPICRAKDVKIIRESAEANGYTDLAFIYKSMAICMEVKRADHADVERSVSTQLPEYMRGMRTSYGIYLVLWHKSGGYHRPITYSDTDVLRNAINNNLPGNLNVFIKILDCSKPLSPSKL